MKRRDLLRLLRLLPVWAAAPALAQARPVRIGVLAPVANSRFLPSALKRLEELGYVEGKNLVIDYRSTGGVAGRFPELARELIRAKSDLIFAIGSEHSVRALLEAKSVAPVVIVAVTYDPVKAGFISSLRRPGGNITGMFFPIFELAAKHMELMREMVPKAKRYLVLADSFTNEHLEIARKAAEQLRVEIVVERFAALPYDFDSAFERGMAAGTEVVIVLDSPYFWSRKIAELAVRHRLPSVVNVQYMGEPEFLIGYGANFSTAFVRLGDIMASILKGQKPADIPVEQPTQFELVVNLKTAKALGINIPASIMLRATRVIE